jgi:hypothetical protein
MSVGFHPANSSIDVNLTCRAVGQRPLNVLICQVNDHSWQRLLMHPLDLAGPNLRSRDPHPLVLKLKAPMIWISYKRVGQLLGTLRSPM